MSGDTAATDIAVMTGINLVLKLLVIIIVFGTARLVGRVVARQPAMKAWLIKYSFALIFLFGGAAAFLTKSESVRDLWWANPVGQVFGAIACLFVIFYVSIYR